MQKRRFLAWGLGAGALLTLGALGVASLEPGLRGERLSPSAAGVMRAVAQAVLEGSLPSANPEREAALRAHQLRVEASIQGLPPATRKELSDLLALLGTSAGRWALCGLRTAWADAPVADVSAALSQMRFSSMALRRQVYQALRELSSAAWFAGPETWVQLGYPGPAAV